MHLPSIWIWVHLSQPARYRYRLSSAPRRLRCAPQSLQLLFASPCHVKHPKLTRTLSGQAEYIPACAAYKDSLQQFSFLVSLQLYYILRLDFDKLCCSSDTFKDCSAVCLRVRGNNTNGHVRRNRVACSDPSNLAPHRNIPRWHRYHERTIEQHVRGRRRLNWTSLVLSILLYTLEMLIIVLKHISNSGRAPVTF